jgi:hypothetical protein
MGHMGHMGMALLVGAMRARRTRAMRYSLLLYGYTVFFMLTPYQKNI